MVYDHEYFDLPTNRIIEIKSNADTAEILNDCVNTVLTDDFEEARKKFHETIALNDFFFLDHQLSITLSKFEIRRALASLSRTIKRNGMRVILAAGFRRVILGVPVKMIKILLKGLGLKKREELSAQHK